MGLFKRNPYKSVWNDPNGRIWTFYCPLCKCERALPFAPHRPWEARNVARVAASAAMFTLLTWEWFKWRGMVSFVPFWIVFETFYRARSRAKLVCRQCGFDPFLTLVDTKKAKAEIEAHWRKRFEEHGIPYPEKGGARPAAPAAPAAPDADSKATPSA